jgi:hypothetical protein
MSPNLRKTTYKAESTRFKYSQKNACLPAFCGLAADEEEGKTGARCWRAGGLRVHLEQRHALHGAVGLVRRLQCHLLQRVGGNR